MVRFSYTLYIISSRVIVSKDLYMSLCVNVRSIYYDRLRLLGLYLLYDTNKVLMFYSQCHCSLLCVFRTSLHCLPESNGLLYSRTSSLLQQILHQ